MLTVVSSKKSILSFSIFVFLIFITACNPAQVSQNQNKPATPEAKSQSSLGADCSNIDSARDKVYADYTKSVEAAANEYAKARQQFEDELNKCLSDIGKGGSCDNEWSGLQDFYEKAMGDISNEEAYQNYKSAKSKWDDCYKNFESKQKELSEKNAAKQQECQNKFQAAIDAAQNAYYEAINAAKAKRDADLEALAELEKKCKEEQINRIKEDIKKAKEAAENERLLKELYEANEEYKQVVKELEITEEEGEPKAPQETTPSLLSAAQICTPSTTQKADDSIAKEVIIEIGTILADDIAKTPIPTSAISDKIFAGIVVAKLNSKIQLLEIEQSDARQENNREKFTEVSKKLAEYREALRIWGRIAAGLPPPRLAPKARACTSDADCGKAVCCNDQTRGVPYCDAAPGS